MRKATERTDALAAGYCGSVYRRDSAVRGIPRASTSRRAAVLAACLTLSFAPAGAAGTAGALHRRSPLGVCSVLGKNDIFRLLGWNVEHIRKRPYRFGSLAGRMCNYESPQGIVTTILPDAGSPFPGISADNTPDAGDLVQNVPGLGAEVQIFNGAVYVTRDRKRVSVRVVPESHPASYADLEPFARLLAVRFHPT